jgi:hypothetical protein
MEDLRASSFVGWDFGHSLVVADEFWFDSWTDDVLVLDS